MTDRAALSVDFELFEHTPAYREAAGTADESGIGLDGAEFLREALADHGATATFFVVSELADEYPAALSALPAEGHEVGSHTHTHRLLSELSETEHREELAGSKERLEDVTGTDVRGFRAPAFDVPAGHFRMLGDAGYVYDASVTPSRSIPGWYGGEYDRQRPGPATAVDPSAPADLAVAPTAVMPGLGLPLTGAWLRFFGPRYTALGMKLLARRGIAPILYVHPWEFVDLPDVDGVPRRVTIRTGAWMRRAIERILELSYEFVTVQDILDDAETAPAVGSDAPQEGT